MFCPQCGKEVENGTSVCPECGASLGVATPKEKKQIKLDPMLAVGVVFSVLSFVFGFVLITCALVAKGGITWLDMISTLPAYVGLGIGVYKLFDPKSGKVERFIALIGGALALFILIYSFITFAVFLT